MESDDIPALFLSLRIPSNHTSVGLSNLVAGSTRAKALFQHKRLPDQGWTDVQIQRLLLELSVLDTNCEEPVRCRAGPSGSGGGGVRHGGGGFPHRWTGAGEREGRIYSPLVSQRHFGFGHGIGRSGDVMEAQPKAVGSSALLRLTLRLTLDAARRGAGLRGKGKNKLPHGPASFGALLPLSTGMSMALVLAGLRDRARRLDADVEENSDGSGSSDVPERNVVLWSRIDQESCYKAVLSAGLKCVVLPTRACPNTDEVSTDLDALKEALDQFGDKVLAVLTTTSCFCPRVPDEVGAVAKLIQNWNEDKGGAGVSHVINHAYGLQCRATNELLNRACTIGRVDAIICSTDKNFLVPVGGALFMSPDSNVIESINKNYPGRASASPMVDLFITLLSMGLDGYKEILEERTRLTGTFRAKFEKVASIFGERILNCPRNTISFGITLESLAARKGGAESEKSQKEQNKEVAQFGSMLFKRCISGTRVVPPHETKTIAGHTFEGFGSSHEGYPCAYMSAACAVGMGEAEIEEFFIRLEKSWRDYNNEKTRPKHQKQAQDVQKDSVGRNVGKALVPDLMRNPKSLHELWKEYESGTGGRKPAKDFTAKERGAVKSKYSFRKYFWDKVEEMESVGISADRACDTIYEAYGNGQKKSITHILRCLKRDRRNGWPPLLDCGLIGI